MRFEYAHENCLWKKELTEAFAASSLFKKRGIPNGVPRILPSQKSVGRYCYLQFLNFAEAIRVLQSKAWVVL